MHVGLCVRLQCSVRDGVTATFLPIDMFRVKANASCGPSSADASAPQVPHFRVQAGPAPSPKRKPYAYNMH